MISLDKLVEIGFTLPKATDISAFLSNIGYIGKFTADDLVEDFVVPDNHIVVISDMSGLNSTFKTGTKYYEDLKALLAQKNNAKPNQGKVNEIHVYQQTEETAQDAFTEFFGIDANWAQLIIASNEKDDITQIAEECEAENRLFVAQTADENILTGSEGNVSSTLMKSGYNNTKVVYHTADEGIDGALACVLANANLGSVGDLYSEFSGITSQEYTATAMSNLDKQNVAYYSTVNAINGGGVAQYGRTILCGNKQAGGEITKRRYIRFTIDLMLKAKVLDFLAKKLSYQEASNNILEGELKSVLIGCQSNDLIVKDNEDTNGLYIKCMPIADIKKLYPTDYSNQVYRANGWYIDALTGTKVVIDLTVNPTDAEKSSIEM
jgi:hypothetical protein